jgi:hypothetical protein
MSAMVGHTTTMTCTIAAATATDSTNVVRTIVLALIRWGARVRIAAPFAPLKPDVEFVVESSGAVIGPFDAMREMSGSDPIR